MRLWTTAEYQSWCRKLADLDTHYGEWRNGPYKLCSVLCELGLIHPDKGKDDEGEVRG